MQELPVSFWWQKGDLISVLHCYHNIIMKVPFFFSSFLFPPSLLTPCSTFWWAFQGSLIASELHAGAAVTFNYSCTSQTSGVKPPARSWFRLRGSLDVFWLVPGGFGEAPWRGEVGYLYPWCHLPSWSLGTQPFTLWDSMCCLFGMLLPASQHLQQQQAPWPPHKAAGRNSPMYLEKPENCPKVLFQ